jgi:hypothetical protein
MSEPNASYCREFINGNQCTCEVFSEPPEDAIRICRECRHGFSKHPEGLNLKVMEYARKKDAGQTGPPPPATGGQSGRQRVLDIFKEHVGRGILKIEQGSEGSNIHKTKITADEAKEEVLKGYRPQLVAGGKGRTKV